LSLFLGLILGLIFTGRAWPTIVAGGVLAMMFLLPVALLLPQVRLRLRGVPVEGVVEHVRWKTVATGGGGAKVTYTATVRFQTRDGVWRTCDAAVGSTAQPGQPLLLYYDPRKPSRAAKLHSLREVIQLIVVLLLVAFTMTGCFFGWVVNTGGFG
jgi:hypothetical protein